MVGKSILIHLPLCRKKKNMKRYLSVFILGLAVACNNASDKETATTDSSSMDHMHDAGAMGNVPDLPPVPDGASVYFKNITEGATVKSPLKIEMGANVIKVDTAGPVIEGVGHHHLIIDGTDSIPAGVIVPKDSTHIHFGKGQTETEIALSPGMHKLTIQFADGLHRSYGDKMAATVHVKVE